MMQEIKIHDIKPLVEISDYSFYMFLAISLLLSVVLIGGIFIFLKWLKTRKKENIRKEHLKILKNINFNETKKAAYMLTKYGATFKDDDTRHKEMYQNMINHLSRYKYKKEVDKFDDKTISVVNLYREICDV